MTLKAFLSQWVCDYSGYEKETKELKNRIEDLKLEAKYYQDNLDLQKANNTLFNKQINELQQLNNTLKLQLEQDKEDLFIAYDDIRTEIETKYKAKNVKYNLAISTKDEIKNYKIDVRNFISTFYDLEEELKYNKLTIKDYIAKYKDLELAQYHLILDIYNYSRKYVKYIYDINLYGASEFWQIPILTYYQKLGDCEDMSHLLLAFYKASGLPAWMFRNTCGMCKLGGHSTVYAYILKENKWYHLEATRTSKYADYLAIPDKAKDDLHITDVWFSFNWEQTYSEFVTNAAKDSYKKQDKYIIGGKK